MRSIDYPLVVECLRELSSRPFQERLWLGGFTREQSSFEEAVEGLYSDSGLGDALNMQLSGLDSSIVSKFSLLRHKIGLVPTGGGQAELIASEAMNDVRTLALELLNLLTPESS